MGCGTTKLQSNVRQPDYHGNIKSSIEISGEKQNDDSTCMVSDQGEALTSELPHSQVEVAHHDDEQGQQVTKCADVLKERESFQSQENSEKRLAVEKQQQDVNKQQKQDVDKQQVNNQQDIFRVGSIDHLQALKREQDEATQYQTINQDFCDNEISERSNELQDCTKEDTICAPIVDVQLDTCNETSCDNDLLTNPQQYCRTARSLSQSPRIVSLQIELGFVSITSADLELLQSKCSG